MAIRGSKGGLSVKFILSISIVIIVASLSLSWFFIKNEETQMDLALRNKGKSLARNLAYISEYGVLTENKELLSNFVEGLVKEEDVVYCIVQDKEAEVLVSAGLFEIGDVFKKIERDVKGDLEREDPRIRFHYSKDKEPIYDISTLIVTQWVQKVEQETGLMDFSIEGVIEETIGVARVGVSLFNMYQQTAKLKKTAILIVFAVIGIGIFVAIFLVRIIVNPVRKLVLGTRRIASGDLVHRVGIKSRDEIGALASSFNQMTEKLKESREEIEDYSKTLELKVEEKTKELRQAQAQLVQSAKMAAVGQLGAGVAHELNNPLGGILGYSQFILDKLKKPEFDINDFKACQRYIESIERESNRCKAIVQNLLKFSRRPIFAKPESINIGRALEETVSIVGHQLKLKNINLKLEIKPDLFNVMGIVNQLQQVFTNLILNAQQAMPEGGELRITAENIIIYKDSSSFNWVKIEFADTGCGIPDDVLGRIFEPFFTTKAREKGTGLGLSVSYEVIENHKGNIEVKSQIGKGTTFIITLPATKEK